MLVLVFTFLICSQMEAHPSTRHFRKFVKKWKCTLSKLIDWAIPETGSNAKWKKALVWTCNNCTYVLHHVWYPPARLPESALWRKINPFPIWPRCDSFISVGCAVIDQHPMSESGTGRRRTIMKKQKWKYLRWDFLWVVSFHALHQVGIWERRRHGMAK